MPEALEVRARSRASARSHSCARADTGAGAGSARNVLRESATARAARAARRRTTSLGLTHARTHARAHARTRARTRAWAFVRMRARVQAGADKFQAETAQLAELQQSRNELLGRVNTLKKDLADWRGKLDTQVRSQERPCASEHSNAGPRVRARQRVLACADHFCTHRSARTAPSSASCARRSTPRWSSYARSSRTCALRSGSSSRPQRRWPTRSHLRCVRVSHEHTHTHADPRAYTHAREHAL